jgi:hypothetical protein
MGRNNKAYSQNPGIILIIGVAFIFCGLYFARDAYATHITVVNSRTWPWAVGTVTAAKINESHGQKGGTWYNPIITYRYYALGNEYICNIRTNIKTSNEDAERVLRSFPLSTKIRVSYNPDRPWECVSEYDEEVIEWLGIASIPIGILLFFYGFINMRGNGE